MKLVLRGATTNDISAIVKMGRDLATESEHFSHVDFSEVKLAGWIRQGLNNPMVECWVVEKDDRIVGSFCASAQTMTMSDQLVLCDHWLYLDPSIRKTLSAGRVIKMFIEGYKAWAKYLGDQVATVLIGVNTGLEEEDTVKIFKRLGGTHYGTMVRF